MKDEKKEAIERIERYLFLLKSLKEDKMDQKIEEEYQKYLAIYKKESAKDDVIRR